MLGALESRKKDSLLASETLNFEFPMDVLGAHSLLVENDVVQVTNLTWNSFTSQNSKTHSLFRQCFVTIHSDL